MGYEKTIVGLMLVTSICLGCDNDDDDDGNNVNATDQHFVLMASIANTAEIDAATLAESKATDEGILDFADMMLNDHGMAKSELKGIADDLNLAAPDSLDAEHVALKALLMSLNGREFDSVYIHSQVKDHEKAIALFNTEVQSGRHQRLRDFATAQLPHLQKHLNKAGSLANKYK